MGAVKRQQATAGVLPFHCGIACSCNRSTDGDLLPPLEMGDAFQLLTSWALRPRAFLEPHNEICTLGGRGGEKFSTGLPRPSFFLKKKQQG
jgi:hypothetical protein